MSNSFPTTETPAGQCAFYGEPQHQDTHVNDRDIFCDEESRDDERGLFVQTSHYLADGDDDELVDTSGSRPPVQVA